LPTPSTKVAIPPIAIDEPTGVDGLRREHVADGGPRGTVRDVTPAADRLDKELLGNVSIRLEATDSPST